MTLSALGVGLASPAYAAPAVYTVTSLGDQGDDTARADCTSGGEGCTLRAAILEANAHANDPAAPDQIQFAFPGDGPHTIAVTAELPTITEPTTISAGLPGPGTARSIEVTGLQCTLSTNLLCEGLVVAADSTTIRGLALNGFSAAIRIQKPGLNVATQETIEGNFIGTNAAGDAVVKHAQQPVESGIHVERVTDSRIGGDPEIGAGNVIAGFSKIGLDLEFVSQTKVLGNLIGTDATGDTGLGGGTGVLVNAGGENTIGQPGEGNTISAMSADGLDIVSGDGNVLQGNRLGTNADASAALGNKVSGINLQADRTLIGGTSTVAGNVISGNGTGIIIQNDPSTPREPGRDSGNELMNNLIGTDATGTHGIGNAGQGVVLGGTGTLVSNNVIAGNGTPSTAGADGVTVELGSFHHRIVNNRIGVGLDDGPLGNEGAGISVGDSEFFGGDNVVGGDKDHANWIAYNHTAGIIVTGARVPMQDQPRGTTIRANSIHDNGGRPNASGLGIDLVTPGDGSGGPDGIDPLDADLGANEKQNAPEITTVSPGDQSTVVTVRLRSAPDQDYTLDLYANPGCDPTGYGEGETWLTSVDVHTAGTAGPDPGTATAEMTVPTRITAAQGMAATATNANGSTSEFSACQVGPDNKAETATTYTGPDTGTYSDPLILSGRLQDVSGSTPIGIPGDELEFTVDSLPPVLSGPTDDSGSASTTTDIDVAAGITSVTTSFHGDPTHDASSDTDQITVRREDCTLGYTGDTQVAPLAQTNLVAQFGETDTHHGDWSGKTITFTVTDSALHTSSYTAVSDSTGLAAARVLLNADVYSVAVSFAGDAYYNRCDTSADILVTVQAAGSKVTGGGWISNSVGRTNFGFNAIPQTDGTYRGQLQVRSNSDKAKFHAHTVTSMTTRSATSVRWTGTGLWNRTAGYTYVVVVVDNGSSGSKKGDTIDLRIYPTTDPSHPVFTSSGAQVLKGGNITVH